MPASIASLMGAFGITRLANLTGLDRVGYPVVAAIRPQSRNLSVSMGKGQTLEQARMSAAMEAAELFFGERAAGKVISSRFADFSVGTAVDPLQLEALPAQPKLQPPGRCVEEPGHTFAAAIEDGLHRQQLDWVSGINLRTGHDVWVPQQSVSMDFSQAAMQAPRHMRGGSTGLAASFDQASARLHGLLEVIERHCHNSWNALDDEDRLKTLVDARSIADEELHELLNRIEAAGLCVFTWDMAGCLGAPCFLVELVDFATESPTAYAQGAAAHPDVTTALFKAVGEALQVRLTYISGSRDDLDWSDYGNRYQAIVDSRRLLAKRKLDLHALKAAPTALPQKPETMFNGLLSHLNNEGKGDVISVSLSGPSDPACAVKIIVPGLKDTPDPDHFARQRRQGHG